MSCRRKIRGVCELLSPGSWTNSKPLWGLKCWYGETKKKRRKICIYDSRKIQSVILSIDLVEIDCIIVLSIPSCKVEYVNKIRRRKCILLNLYCYKRILLTVKYVLDAIYFSREVTFTYFLTLPQLHSPNPFFFKVYLKKMHYIMVYWITIIQMEKCM